MTDRYVSYVCVCACVCSAYGKCANQLDIKTVNDVDDDRMTQQQSSKFNLQVFQWGVCAII